MPNASSLVYPGLYRGEDNAGRDKQVIVKQLEESPEVSAMVRRVC